MFGWFKKKSPQPAGPDFSTIESQAKPMELFERGYVHALNKRVGRW